MRVRESHMGYSILYVHEFGCIKINLIQFNRIIYDHIV